MSKDEVNLAYEVVGRVMAIYGDDKDGILARADVKLARAVIKQHEEMERLTASRDEALHELNEIRHEADEHDRLCAAEMERLRMVLEAAVKWRESFQRDDDFDRHLEAAIVAASPDVKIPVTDDE